jgi:heme-degrading monooxygenase HmoA
MIAPTPQPPYYAVIFTSVRTEGDHGYEQMANEMVALGSTMKGFLGIESAREEIGISVSYWDSLESIKAWKAEAAHQIAQEKGRSTWYSAYKTRVCLVERDYGFEQ